jgi:hypothetical protein
VIAVVLKSFTRALVVTRWINQKVCEWRYLANNGPISHNLFLNPIDFARKTVINYFEYVQVLSAFVLSQTFNLTYCIRIWWFDITRFWYESSSLAPGKHSVYVATFAGVASLIAI